MRRAIRHVRVEWDLAKVPALLPTLPPKHEIRLGNTMEVETIWEGMQRSILNEKAWLVSPESHLDTMRKSIFPEGKLAEGVDLLMLFHGARMIGVSALRNTAGDEVSLLSGVLIDYEYQRRGLGTALLQASLSHLAEKGCKKAAVVTREVVPAVKYLYPKFGGKVVETPEPGASKA